ncbi:MAG: hypothetical protein EOO38_26035, partial [Cytophagaceae bacterium]
MTSDGPDKNGRTKRKGSLQTRDAGVPKPDPGSAGKALMKARLAQNQSTHKHNSGVYKKDEYMTVLHDQAAEGKQLSPSFLIEAKPTQSVGISENTRLGSKVVKDSNMSRSST